MRRIALSVVLFFCATNSYSQMTKDSLVNILVNKICNKVSSSKNQAADFEKIMNDTSELMPIISQYEKEIGDLFGGLSNINAQNEFAKLLMSKLISQCPILIEYYMSKPDATSTLNVKGNLLRIGIGEFSFIEIKKANNKIEKVYWFEAFQGSNILIDESNKLLNKKVKVAYKEMAVFKATTRTYQKIKVITSLEKE